MTRAEPFELDDPTLYLNRELSLLEFNRRVLAQALDDRIPLLERLRFLSILSSNLDEFFEVRAAGLQQQVVLEVARATPDAMTPQEVLERVSEVAHDLINEQYRTLNQTILPALKAEGIRLLKRSAWSPTQQEWIAEYFREQALPVLTPVALDPGHPFPNVQNKSLNFVVSLRGEDAFGRRAEIAIVQVPRCLPRIIALPNTEEGAEDFVMISSVIHDHVGELFPGMEVVGCYQFRVTRNSDFWVDEEEIDDLLSALQGELPHRPYGEAVRLEVADNCNPAMSRFLLERFGLSERDLYRVNGPVNLHRLSALWTLVERPALKYPPFVPAVPEVLRSGVDLFSVLGQQDILLLHPFHSFNPVLELLRQAAADPDVLAIKQTVYRTGADSPVFRALLKAARAGKAVTAVVELRARFDEAANIRVATQLQEAGVNVVYGVFGHKCHAKMMMIVRREGRGLRRYVHLGTGNYHPGNAKIYTDYSLMTGDPTIGRDIHQIFLHLTGLGRAAELEAIAQSPFTLFDHLIDWIGAEEEAAREGRPARIRAKMNSLTEPRVIQALYRASQAGVRVDLIVRGICRLRPGVPGVSENIQVRSIVGRFLEHSRVYNFHAGGEERVYCASADWMERNLDHRVEACFPILEPTLKRRVITEALEWGLEDNEQAWILQQDGSYARAEGSGRSSQRELLESLGG